ncbi:MAG: SoxR reducing system RseC family protein [Bacteroidales bacterium]|nr:SoxR reducing system RseC family protein [Bacteroidales bacterium]
MKAQKKEDCNSSEAIIKKIEGEKITVQVLKSDNCDGCSAALICESSSRGKTIEVSQSNANIFEVGERVMLNVPQSKTFKALGLAFLYPLLLILACCLLCHYVFGLSDAFLALLSLVILAIYYFALYKLRNKPFFNFSLSVSKK